MPPEELKDRFAVRQAAPAVEAPPEPEPLPEESAEPVAVEPFGDEVVLPPAAGPVEDCVVSGALEEETVAVIEPLGPHAVDASAAATSTPADRLQRAVLLRTMSLFHIRCRRSVSGDDASGPTPGTLSITGGSDDSGTRDRPDRRLLQLRGTTP
jgi:hypothetical protein